MSELRAAIARVKEDAGAARAYFHTWWGLRSLALPQFHSTLNNYTYVDFFHAANSGFLKLTFVSLAKLFDRDDRALGFSRLREVLAASGRVDDSTFLQERLAPHEDLVRRVLGIRNKSVSHNEAAVTRDEVYERYGVTPDELRDLIADTCDVLNELDERMGSGNRISEGNRHERAVLALLETLRRGNQAQPL